jgi:aminoglycoside 6'-N-acetyltransferase I
VAARPEAPFRVSVRRADAGDLATVVSLRLALLREHGDHPLYADLAPDVIDRAFDLYHAQILAADERVFIAEAGGETVGILRAVDVRGSPLVLPERYCYVSSVYVVPPARRRGVMRALVRAAEAWCDERGLGEMRLHNAASSGVAASAWSALGFAVVEQVRRRTVHGPAESHEDAEVAAHVADATR